MEMRLPPDFKEFIELCNSTKLEYLVVGGFAVAHYGHYRFTADIDFWIRRSKSNANRMVRVLRAFGYAQPGLKEELFLQPNKVLQLGVPPVRIDILNDISGVSFEECYVRRTEAKWEGVNVPVIGYEDLIANKQASGRAKDIDDVKEMTGPKRRPRKPRQ